MSEHCATYSCNKQLGTVKSIEKLPRLYGAGRWSTRWRRLLRRRVLLLGNETMPQNLKTDLEYIYMRMIYIYIYHYIRYNIQSYTYCMQMLQANVCSATSYAVLCLVVHWQHATSRLKTYQYEQY